MIEAFPTVLLVVLILGVGSIVARRIRAPVEAAVGRLTIGDRLADTPLAGAVEDSGHIARLAGALVQLYGFLFVVLLAAEVADIGVISEFAALLVRFVPELVAGGVIIVAGLVLGDIAAARARSTVVVTESAYGGWIVATVTATIYVVTAVIGLETIGFELQIVYLIVEGLVSAIGIGIAAAIALAVGVAAGFYAKEYIEPRA